MTFHSFDIAIKLTLPTAEDFVYADLAAQEVELDILRGLLPFYESLHSAVEHIISGFARVWSLSVMLADMCLALKLEVQVGVLDANWIVCAPVARCSCLMLLGIALMVINAMLAAAYW